MTFLKRVGAGALLCTIVMAGLGLWSQAEAEVKYPVERFEQVEQMLLEDQVATEWGVIGWTQAVDAKQFTDMVDAELARQEAARQAALAALAASRRVVPSGTSVAPSGGGNAGAGGACGGATNGADAFIGRESGGSATIYNGSGSGAWGCYQIMPATWNSSCSDLGVHGSAGASAQAACASRLPLSAWASSGPT